MAPRHKKPKPLKKRSAKSIALQVHRKLSKMEKQVDTKWNDRTIGYSSQSYACFPETTVVNSVYNLTNIQPLGVTNTATTDQFLNSANKRVGTKVYISGLYLKLQAFWDNQLEASTDVRYPPYCNINWAVVRQKNNEGGVAADAADIIPPQPLDVWQNPAIQDTPLTGEPDTALTISDAPLGNLVFRNMNNSKNYVVLKRGCIYMNGPGNVNTAPAETSTDDQITTFTPGSLANSEMRNFGSNAVKTFNINLHPKCITQWFQADVAGTEQDTTASDLLTPIKNGLYFMSWVDVGGASTRFRPPGGAGYVYDLPSLVGNVRVRFRDL